MASKTKRLSTLIETQLPGFISSEYQNFSAFVEKYYEFLESKGQVLDVIGNITQYTDINYYEKNLLKEYTVLNGNISSSQTSIVVEDASSFPEQNGYIRIGDEICFYKTRTDTQFLEVSRGISGNTTLGDLYSETTFVSTVASSHLAGEQVLNISNLFLYALVKNFESQYLDAFPQKYLNPQVDKRNLIKNIQKFYKAKGAEASIKFIFNSIISNGEDDTPTIFYPKDNTLKASTSDWVTKYSLKVKLLLGDPNNLIGQKIEQFENVDENILYASAVVDNVIYYKEDVYEIILNPTTINNKFNVPRKTQLTKSLDASFTDNDRIDVDSTLGWDNKGSVLINNELITFKSKNVNQFVIETRSAALSHNVGSDVFSLNLIEAFGCRFIILGVLYNLNLSESNPYSEVSDKIQISKAGFETTDPIIYDSINSRVRWILNTQNTAPLVYQNTTIQNAISDLNADVSAIYEDDQYYYICSTSFPSHRFLNSTFTNIPQDQKLLKLIRKVPTTATEVYETTEKDIGIFVDGVPAYGAKDEEIVLYGNITKTTVTYGGSGYKKAPFVLINGVAGRAVANMSGEVVESISIVTNEIYQSTPAVTITAGRNAQARAIVTKGEITRIVVLEPGEYYSSPPLVRIVDLAGKGNFAEYKAIISDNGQVIDFEQISPGKFYTEGNVYIDLIEDGRSSEATAEVEIRKWYRNRYTKRSSQFDDSYGYLFNTGNGYGYGYAANPRRLRAKVGDNLNSNLTQFSTKIHSRILGYAYDGNPIYGPFAYSDPFNKSSSITRLLSGYTLNSSRPSGPPVSQYPLGSFVDDYTWTANSSTGKTYLDKNNGRFCITPEYPNGTYAYFITVNSSDQPVFPYILGKNYYSLPVDSNYNGKISQDNLPKNITRLRTSNLKQNGQNSIVTIQEVNTGQVSGYDIQSSANTFKVGSSVRINNVGTEGDSAAAVVSSITGEYINYIECVQVKPLEIITNSVCYLFAGDRVLQASTGAYGEVLGDVTNGTQIILRNVVGTFNTTNLISADIQVVNLFLNTNATFTKNAVVSLIDLSNSTVAQGIILESTNRQNSLKVKVTQGTFTANSSYFLRSSNLFDSPKVGVESVSSLSKNISIFSLDNKIAVAKFSKPHNLTKNDQVNIDIIPSDADTRTVYYVRKRLYQSVILNPPTFNGSVNDTGIGRFDLLNGGADYQTGTYTNVELIFSDTNKVRSNVGALNNPNNARATIQVSNINGSGRGRVTSVTITTKGKNYKKGDILSVADFYLNRLSTSQSTQRLTLVVDHVGFAKENTTLNLNSIEGLSINDELQIGNEILKITNVNSSTNVLTVSRGQYNTEVIDHYHTEAANLINPKYNFTYATQPLGGAFVDPYVFGYNQNNQELTLAFNYGLDITGINSATKSNIFYDNSSPRKIVSVSEADVVKYKLQFSKSTTDSTFVSNPIIDITKHYTYKFDTSHYSMSGTYLDFSPSLNYNIIPYEIKSTNTNPGNSGSSITVKFGYVPELYTSYDISASITDNYIVTGELIVEDDFIVSTNIINSQGRKTNNFKFLNYYYFDKNNPNISEKGYITLKDDPLQGEKTVYYTTANEFVYKVDTLPEYDGIGDITYTTNSLSAIGKITDIVIKNGGQNYKRIPIIDGVDVAQENEAIVDVGYDFDNKTINYINVLSYGKNYIKPKAVVVDGDGSGAIFDVISVDGEVFQVNVIDGGKNYTYKPSVKIIESDVKIYLKSNNIGTIKSINFLDSGYNYHLDRSLLSKYNSNTVLLVKNHQDNSFAFGEQIIQTNTVNNVKITVASGVVAKNGWRYGSNILRLENVTGVFDEKLPIQGLFNNKTANIISVISSKFTTDIRSYSDNIGYFNSDRGKLSNFNQRLTDSFYYQDYSYKIKSKTPIDLWRDLIKQTIHPAGFQLFGEVLIESDGKFDMPSEPENHFENIVYVNLQSKQIDVKVNKKYLTQTVINYADYNVEKGIGTACVDDKTNVETVARELILSTPFNGSFDPYDGQVIGNRTFTLLEKESNLPYQIYNEQQLVVALDGVLQEPGVAYTVNGNQITFASAPFGERIMEGQVVAAQKFYCRSIKFKSADLNSRYMKKLKSIAPNFDGITRVFDLYYEDGSIVKTDTSETLLVFLNGVLQKSKVDEDVPFGNSYHIVRSTNSTVTDKIEFTDPPINHSDLYSPIQTELGAAEKCYIYSICNYKRLTIDQSLIPYKPDGPFLIVNEATQKVVNVREPKYALVFIDGVLQIPNESYIIIGSTISFKKPLNYFIAESGEENYPDVSILLFYGRDLSQAINVFDFEPNTYFNVLKLSISGVNIFETIKNIDGTPDQNALSSQNILVYQSGILYGELKEIKALSNTEVEFTILNSLNLDLSEINDTTITLVINRKQTLTIPGSYTVTGEYVVDSDNNRLLKTGINVPIWLFNTEYANKLEELKKYKKIANILPGDLIKLDGEDEYRQVLSVPNQVRTKNYNTNESANNEIFASISCSSYNGITRGEGLSISAKVFKGKVVELVWNKRELEEYLKSNVLLQPTAYQYFTNPVLHFVPSDGNGGGAQAEIVVCNGQILDIIITSSGSGYTSNPDVYVARQYSIIRKKSRKIIDDLDTTIHIIPKIKLDYSVISEIEILETDVNIFYILTTFSILSPKDTTNVFTRIFTPNILNLKSNSLGGRYKILNQTNTIMNSIVSTNRNISNIIELPSKQVVVDYNNTVRTSSYFTGTVDVTYEGDFNIEYSQNILGNRLACFETAKFAEIGFSDVSKITIEEFTILYPDAILDDFTNKNTVSISATNKIRFNLGYSSIQNFGALLDSPVGLSDTIVYVASTSAFPSQGKLLLGDEIISYTSKLSDRFLGVVRGVDNTKPKLHSAGDYIRTF